MLLGVEGKRYCLNDFSLGVFSTFTFFGIGVRLFGLILHQKEAYETKAEVRITFSL